MRVLLGSLGEVAGPGGHGGSGEEQESQAGRGGHEHGPDPRRLTAACGAGSTFAFGGEGVDQLFLAAEFRCGGRGLGRLDQAAQVRVAGGEGGGVGLGVSPLAHRMKESA
ncbi:hypothetical protein [Actinoplanes sp. NPDC048796]|uniref:hypothetical protein n=1 Tax=Actinoplanes sp. NPDC048796 TaxID=3155640 RepID=UPI00340D215A